MDLVRWYLLSVAVAGSLAACSGTNAAPRDGSTSDGATTPSPDAADAGAEEPAGEARCAGLSPGDAPDGVPDWDTIACAPPAEACADLGGKTRRYKLCASVSAADGGGCGEAGQTCALREVVDSIPCLRQVPNDAESPIAAGPWGECASADRCSMSGQQARDVSICVGGVLTTTVSSRPCVREVEALPPEIGPWEECAYEDACVETGERRREISSCEGGATVSVTESEPCTRSTEGTAIAERTRGSCAPAALTGCGDQGTVEVGVGVCRGGVEVLELDSAACALARAGATSDYLIDDGSASFGADLSLAQSLVELAMAETATIVSDAPYDGARRSIDFTGALAGASPSPRSVLIDAGGVELSDAQAEGTLVSGDGTSFGTIDYATGDVHVDFAAAPPAGTLTRARFSTAASLTVQSENADITLCRLRKVHGDLLLDLGQGGASARFDGLQEILGDLIIRQGTPDASAAIVFSALERVRGGVLIEGASFDAIDLPNLAQIDGDLRIAGNEGIFFELPQLGSVGGSMFVGDPEGNDGLLSFSMQNLTDVAGSFAVVDNAALQFWITNLARVGGDLRVNEPNISVCDVFDTYVRVIESRLGVQGAIEVNGVAGGQGAYADGDGDGYVDACDNCSSTFNADQTDSDGDGAGNECDPTPGG